jgi:hypothetical protein
MIDSEMSGGLNLPRFKLGVPNQSHQGNESRVVNADSINKSYTLSTLTIDLHCDTKVSHGSRQCYRIFRISFSLWAYD